MPILPRFSLVALLALGACQPKPATLPETVGVLAEIPAVEPTNCTLCEEWNVPREPFTVFGNTHYVGTDGLGSVLITSDQGHVLIDGALAESAAVIKGNIEALGFKLADVKLILNTHAHFDHSGGLAALQRASGAEVAASPASAAVLEAGLPGEDDPQHGELVGFPMARVPDVRRVSDGEHVRVGPLDLTANFTPGHTSGGTSWTWTSCEGSRCLNMVYADSMTPVSEEGYRFSESTRNPEILADFERGFAAIEAFACDILITPHPGASDFFARVEARDAGDETALVNSASCRDYAAAGRRRLEARLSSEREGAR